MANSHPSPRRRPLVLGILNVTPDSFSDGGSYASTEQALERASVMLAEGADIIDVGGESTRPGAASVTIDEEVNRVLPVIEGLKGQCRVAVDTRRAEVARVAVAAGATIINDVSADLGALAAELDVGWIAMHMLGEPHTMQADPVYKDVVAEVRDYLVTRAEAASTAGVSDVWIDPGFGFGKTLAHNMSLLAGIDTFVATGWPVAIGTSRKSMLGELLGRSDGISGKVLEDDRLDGSVTTATYAMLQGVDLIRVHDIKAAKQAATVIAGEEAEPTIAV